MTRSTLVLAALAAGACKPGICNSQARAFERSCDEKVSDAELDACEDALAFCSDDEEDRLIEFDKCVASAGYAPCSDQTTAEVGAYLDCLEQLDGVSVACLEGDTSPTVTGSSPTP